MMNKKHLIFICISLICIFHLDAQNYITLAKVISSGGGVSSGGNYANFGILGETFIDNSAGGIYTNHTGFVFDEITVCTPPSVPQNVTASDGSYANEIYITWNAVNDATEYKIFRDGNYLAVTNNSYYSDNAAPCKEVLYEIYSLNDTCKSASAGSDTGYKIGCEDEILSIVENFSDGILIYPNPANNQLTIELNNGNRNITGLVIYDLLGKTLLLKQKGELQVQKKYNLNISALKQGFYYISVDLDNEKMVKKFTVVK